MDAERPLAHVEDNTATQGRHKAPRLQKGFASRAPQSCSSMGACYADQPCLRAASRRRQGAATLGCWAVALLCPAFLGYCSANDMVDLPKMPISTCPQGMGRCGRHRVPASRATPSPRGGAAPPPAPISIPPSRPCRGAADNDVGGTAGAPPILPPRLLEIGPPPTTRSGAYDKHTPFRTVPLIKLLAGGTDNRTPSSPAP